MKMAKLKIMGEYLHKLRQVQANYDSCHTALDGIVPRNNNAGESYTLLGRLQILIAAIEFCANQSGEPALSDQVFEYRKSRACPPAHAPKHRYHKG